MEFTMYGHKYQLEITVEPENSAGSKYLLIAKGRNGGAYSRHGKTLLGTLEKLINVMAPNEKPY